MAFNDLRGEGKAVKEVRDNTTNKNLAKIVARRATTLVSVVSKLKINRTSTAPSAMYVITRTIVNVMLTSKQYFPVERSSC